MKNYGEGHIKVVWKKALREKMEMDPACASEA